MRLLIAVAVMAACSLANDNSDDLLWTTEDIESEDSIEDHLNKETPFLIYTFKDFSVALFEQYNSDRKWNTNLLKSIKSSKQFHTGVVSDTIEVNKDSGTVVKEVSSWEELEDAFAADMSTIGDKKYSALIIKPESVVFVKSNHRVKRVSIKTKPSQGARRKQPTSRLRSKSRKDELDFPIVLPPYHKSEKYPVSEENPENFGNCLLYLEGITVIVHKADSTPGYVAALIGNNENHKYLFADDDVQCVATSRKNTAFDSVRGEYSFDVTVKVAPEGVVAVYDKSPMFEVVDSISFKLLFNTTSPKTWELVNVELSEITINPVQGSSYVNEKLTIDEAVSAKPKHMNVYSTDPYGYGCSDTQAVFYPVESRSRNKYQVGIAFHNFQVELYGVYRDEKNDKIRFSQNVNDCVGTFSAGSLMGIIVAIILASILIFAFLMLNSVQTMDRFDDPKQKQIVINVRE
ncbi:hypothetical protein QR680_002297 [Steinernema hermaphroditum]|uniref:V-type proton ATPase subunit S1/VOA1 transmembrane domain-containing protein n=1 Tax=Steinernema hermaphroditum TaxID=289476 RepID=A0AA39H257_9BILA|nr:hypothetical protein QR680_002297 [Steinernema hermaphroditum]